MFLEDALCFVKDATANTGHQYDYMDKKAVFGNISQKTIY